MRYLKTLGWMSLAVILALAGFWMLSGALSPVGAESESTFQYFVVSKEPSVTTALPGERVTYTITVSGPTSGTLQMDFDVTIMEFLPDNVSFVSASEPYQRISQGVQWSRVFSPNVGSKSVTFTVVLDDVLASDTEILNEHYQAFVGDTLIQGEPVTVMVGLVPTFTLTPERWEQEVFFGEQATLPFTLTNTGNGENTFVFTSSLASPYTTADWEVTTPSSLTLKADERGMVDLAISVGAAPPTSSVTATLWLTATATKGKGDVTHAATVHLTATKKSEPMFEMIALDPQVNVLFRQPLTSTYLLTNTSQTTQTFNFTGALSTIPAVTDWVVRYPPSLTLSAEQSGDVDVLVNVGAPSSEGKVAATLTLTATAVESGITKAALTHIYASLRYIYLPLTVKNYPPIPVISNVTVTSERGGPGYSYGAEVAVAVEAEAATERDMVKLVRFSADGNTWTAWETYATTSTTPYSFTLTGASGYKTIYAQVKGAAGGVSEPTVAGIAWLANGDFEDELTNWTLANHKQSVPAVGDDGRVLLGNPSWPCRPAPIGEATISQRVDLQDVPSGKRVKLYLDYEIHTEDKMVGDVYDHFGILINGQKIYEDGNRRDDFGCDKDENVISKTDHMIEVDDKYLGQVITLLIGNYTRFDDWYNTYTYVDNVRIVIEE